MGRRGYPPEFRRRALDLIEAGRPIIRDVARDLDVSEQSIYTWRRQDRIDRGVVAGLASIEKAELTAARRRITELEAELKIARCAAELANALGMAVESRNPAGTLTHSDQGPQFTSGAFTQRAKTSGLVPSMGSVGDCYDNAMVGSFWSRMQVALLDRQRWRTRIELATAIFEYLEIFHNRQRRHSALGYRTPIEFETQPIHIVA